MFFTYPMKTPSRRGEVNPKIIKEIGQNYKNVRVIKPASKNQALEGTGSLIFDNQYRKVYCCLSERADKDTLSKFMKEFNAGSK